jgi:hypothetical protein
MAEEGVEWPGADDADGWAALANLALQLESMQVDLKENREWAATIKALVLRGLPYPEYTTERMAALERRLRQRKLAQTNLRYKYGFKGRRASLVRRDVREYLAFVEVNNRG